MQLGVGAVVFATLDPRGVVQTADSLRLSGWLGIAFLGLCCSVFAFLVQLWAVRRTSAARASLLMGTEPVWAVLVGMTVGGEAIGRLSAGGAVLVVLATGWGQRVESRHRAARQQALPGGLAEAPLTPVAS